MRRITRRNFLNAMGAAALVAGLAPDVFAEEDEDPRFWEEAYDEERHIRDYLFKMKHFDVDHPDDVFLSCPDFDILKTSLARLKRLQRTVGHGTFYRLNFGKIFADTDVFSSLKELGYIQFRYREKNLLGGRFEPWHISVLS